MHHVVWSYGLADWEHIIETKCNPTLWLYHWQIKGCTELLNSKPTTCTCVAAFVFVLHRGVKAHAHRRRRVCTAQITTRPVCIEQYTSTGSKPERCVSWTPRWVACSVCMPQLNNTCANFYAKYLTLNAGRQRLRCAWAITANRLQVLS